MCAVWNKDICKEKEKVAYLGAFAKVWKRTVSFVMSVCPCGPVVMKFWYLVFEDFSKIFEENSVWLKSDKNNKYVFDNIVLNSSQNEKCFRHKLQRKSKHVFIWYLLLFVSNNGYLNAPQCHTYIASLVLWYFFNLFSGVIISSQPYIQQMLFC